MATPSLGEFEQLVLLALVRLGDDAYGMSIHDELQRRARRDVTVAAVYKTLERLEDKGLAVSRGRRTDGGTRRTPEEVLPDPARGTPGAGARAGVAAAHDRRPRRASSIRSPTWSPDPCCPRSRALLLRMTDPRVREFVAGDLEEGFATMARAEGVSRRAAMEPRARRSPPCAQHPWQPRVRR